MVRQYDGVIAQKHCNVRIAAAHGMIEHLRFGTYHDIAIPRANHGVNGHQIVAVVHDPWICRHDCPCRHWSTTEGINCHDISHSEDDLGHEFPRHDHHRWPLIRKVVRPTLDQDAPA